MPSCNSRVTLSAVTMSLIREFWIMQIRSSRSAGTPSGKYSSSTSRTARSFSIRIRRLISASRLLSARDRWNSSFRPSFTARLRRHLGLLHGGPLDLELHLRHRLALLLQGAREGRVPGLVAQPFLVQPDAPFQHGETGLRLLDERARELAALDPDLFLTQARRLRQDVVGGARADGQAGLHPALLQHPRGSAAPLALRRLAAGLRTPGRCGCAAGGGGGGGALGCGAPGVELAGHPGPEAAEPHRHGTVVAQAVHRRAVQVAELAPDVLRPGRAELLAVAVFEVGPAERRHGPVRGGRPGERGQDRHLFVVELTENRRRRGDTRPGLLLVHVLSLPFPPNTGIM